MKFKTIISIALLVGCVVVGVQIVDPSFTSSASDSECKSVQESSLCTAIEKLSVTNYKYTVTKYTDGEVQHKITVKVSHSSRQIRASSGDRITYERYFTDGGTWMKLRNDVGWAYIESSGYQEGMAPFRSEPLDDSPSPETVDRGDTTVLQYGEETPNAIFWTTLEQSFGPSMRDLRIVIDDRTNRIRNVSLVVDEGGGTTRYVYDFSYGDVTVNRPSEIPVVTIEEIRNDLFDRYEEDGLFGL